MDARQSPLTGRQSPLSGRNRLAATFGVLFLLLGLASCSRFKTMWLCTKSCACSEEGGPGGTGEIDPKKALAAAKNPGAAAKKAGKAAGKDALKGGTGGPDGEGAGDGSGDGAGDGSESKPAGAGDGTGDGAGSSGDGDDDDDDSSAPVDFSGGPKEGTLILAKNLELAGPISGGSVKMRKRSNDKIYIFYYDSERRDVAEELDADEAYDVTYKARRKCPGESDFCGTFVTADER